MRCVVVGVENESSRNGGRTRTARKGHRILSPVRLPIPPSGQLFLVPMLLLTWDRDNGHVLAAGSRSDSTWLLGTVDDRA